MAMAFIITKNNGAGAAQNDVVLPVETGTAQPQNNARFLDPDEFRRQGHQVIDFIADYYARVGDYPVHPTSVHPGFLRRQLPADAPSRPELDTFGAALRDVRDLILPDLTHWQSPRQLAHFPASSSTVAALGEALTAGINIVPFTWDASPAATELEMVVVDRLGKALHLPETLLFCGGSGGTLLGTTCEAILCALVAARGSKFADIGTAAPAATIDGARAARLRRRNPRSSLHGFQIPHTRSSFTSLAPSTTPQTRAPTPTSPGIEDFPAVGLHYRSRCVHSGTPSSGHRFL